MSRGCKTTKQAREDGCVFCQIADKKIPATYLFEDDDIMIIENIHPVVKVHVLVIPKSHIVLNEDKFQGCDKAILADLMLLARKAAEMKGISGSGYRVVVNTGKDALADFEHLHLHVMGGEKLSDH